MRGRSGLPVGGGGHLEANALLRANGVDVTAIPRDASYTVRLALSARRRAEATAGCSMDAYVAALRDALDTTTKEDTTP